MKTSFTVKLTNAIQSSGLAERTEFARIKFSRSIQRQGI